MRKLTLTALQFDSFVFQQVATSAAKNDDEWDVALRTIRKLKDPALTEAIELTPQEHEACARGAAVYQFRRLREESAVFLLEEDEMRLLTDRVKAHKTSVALVAAEDFNELLETLRDAPQADLKVEV